MEGKNEAEEYFEDLLHLEVSVMKSEQKNQSFFDRSIHSDSNKFCPVHFAL